MMRRSLTARFFTRSELRDTRGTAVVEFALIFPILAILLFGVIDFGRAYFLRTNLVSAAREGARYGAAMTNPCLGSSTTTILAQVQRYVTYFGGGTVTATVSTPGACAANSVTNVKVKISNYAFVPITPVFRLINYNTALTISDSASYRWEQSEAP